MNPGGQWQTCRPPSDTPIVTAKFTYCHLHPRFLSRCVGFLFTVLFSSLERLSALSQPSFHSWTHSKALCLPLSWLFAFALANLSWKGDTLKYDHRTGNCYVDAAKANSLRGFTYIITVCLLMLTLIAVDFALLVFLHKIKKRHRSKNGRKSFLRQKSGASNSVADSLRLSVRAAAASHLPSDQNDSPVDFPDKSSSTQKRVGENLSGRSLKRTSLVLMIGLAYLACFTIPVTLSLLPDGSNSTNSTSGAGSRDSAMQSREGSTAGVDVNTSLLCQRMSSVVPASSKKPLHFALMWIDILPAVTVPYLCSIKHILVSQATSRRKGCC